MNTITNAENIKKFDNIKIQNFCMSKKYKVQFKSKQGKIFATFDEKKISILHI